MILTFEAYADVSKEGSAFSFKFVHRRRFFPASPSRIAKSAASHLFLLQWQEEEAILHLWWNWGYWYTPFLECSNFSDSHYYTKFLSSPLLTAHIKVRVEQNAFEVYLLEPNGFYTNHQVQHSSVPLSVRKVHLCVLYVSKNSDFFPLYSIKWSFLYPRCKVFTARYDLYL